MNLSHETIDKKFSLPKTANKTAEQKNSWLFHRNNRLFIPTNNKQN